MPILKKEEKTPERPTVIVLYGEAGIGKTSVFNTSEHPILIDFDRGFDRAIYRQDTVLVNSWEDVIKEEKAGTFNGYSTIGIDTAKAALDDFLMNYVLKIDYKNTKNKLAAYGAIGDEFKLFISKMRSDLTDIVIIAHAKDDKDGDLTKKIPDVTGGSYNLLLRIADQVGYMCTVNNERVIQWEPTDRTIGKNVARLPLTNIPDENDPAFKTFLRDIIREVKMSISKMSAEQQENEAIMNEWVDAINTCTEPEILTQLLKEVNELPEHFKAALGKVISVRASALKFISNKEKKCFERNTILKPGYQSVTTSTKRPSQTKMEV